MSKYDPRRLFSEPLLGPDGEVLDGGADISFASIASYYQDVIYLCSFVQVFCIYTDKAFWAFWLLPLVAGWIVYNSVIKPLMAHSASTKVQTPAYQIPLLEPMSSLMSFQ